MYRLMGYLGGYFLKYSNFLSTYRYPFFDLNTGMETLDHVECRKIQPDRNVGKIQPDSSYVKYVIFIFFDRWKYSTVLWYIIYSYDSKKIQNYVFGILFFLEMD